MKRRLFVCFLALTMLLSLTACGGSPTEETSQEPLVDIQPQEPEAPPEPTPEELAAQEVEDLLASLTLEEKVGQLFFVRVPDTDAVSDVSTYHLGGYILFGRDTADKTADALIQTIQSYQDAAAADTGIPLLIGVVMIVLAFKLSFAFAPGALRLVDVSLPVMAHADWVIDLGPEAGTGGGRVVFEGTPRNLEQCPASYTGKYLRLRTKL